MVKHVWVAEVRYEHLRWYTLWTTCSLTKWECREAVKNHGSVEHFTKARIVKFVRA